MKAKYRSSSSLFMLTLFSFGILGCVSVTNYDDEPRHSVRFSTPEAAQIFYETHLGVVNPETANTSITLLIPAPYWQHTEPSENTKFNSAVKVADQNGDSVISEIEARAFAAAYGNTEELSRLSSPE